MSMFLSHKEIEYQNFEQCKDKLPAVEAIDYFFAKNIIYHCFKDSTHPDLMLYVQEMFHVCLALSMFQRQGHVCLDIEQIANKRMFIEESDTVQDETLIGYVFQDKVRLSSIIEYCVAQLRSETQASDSSFYLSWYQGLLYSRRYYFYELELFDRLLVKMKDRGLESSVLEKENQLRTLFDLAFNKQDANKHNINHQLLACLNCLFNRFSIITGSAGTGKTYTIARLTILASLILSIPIDTIELLAPTGKAAQRLQESLQNEISKLIEIDSFRAVCEQLSLKNTKTIHRLLKINPRTSQAEFDGTNRLDSRLIIVDEASMLDIGMLYKLVTALDSDAMIILVGDANQLPSVEAGSVFSDLVNSSNSGISSKRIKQLVKIYPDVSELIGESDDHYKGLNYLNRLEVTVRGNNELKSFSEAIIDNDKKALFAKYDNVLLIDDPQSMMPSQFIQTWVIENIVESLHCTDVNQAFACLKRYILLSPLRKGFWGAEALNVEIERQLRDRFGYISPNQMYKGRPIMVLQNDYQLNLFNGDIGLIWPDETGKLYAYFERESNKLEAFGLFNLPKLQSNYVMTIHKSQGSEFDNVDVILSSVDHQIINKTLVYTAATRAKQTLRVFAQKQTLTQAINRPIHRCSGLNKRFERLKLD